MIDYDLIKAWNSLRVEKRKDKGEIVRNRGSF